MEKKSTSALLICFLISSFAYSQVYGQSKIDFPVLKHPAPGYYLLAPTSPGSLSIFDHAGNAAYSAPAGLPINLLNTDSTLTYFDARVGELIQLNTHFVAIDTFTIKGDYLADTHEGHILSNGNRILLGVETRTMDLSALVDGGKSEAQVQGAVVQEQTPTGLVVFEWKSLDHIPVLDALVDLRQATIDYIHVNSVCMDTDGNYLISCRHTDEIIKVNRSTGEVMWRLGGEKSKGNQFTFLNDEVDGFTGFSHQHDAFRTAGGNIMMFDNGSLKPTRYSRAAEYEVNETLKTVKLVWSHRPTPDVFTSSMGSVQELSNGNVLIGYGSTQSTLVAQELSRDGTIQMEMRNDSAVPSYRVRKAVFAMSGTERKVSTTGTVAFTHGDSTTHFSTTLSRVSAPTSIIAERHSYAPHNMSFGGSSPCIPMQMRWVVRASDVANITGNMRFAIGSFGLEIPPHVQIYHRPKEGDGAFMQINASFDPTTLSLVLTEFRAGEYMIAYPMCYNPVPSVPGNNVVTSSNTVLLRWTEAVESGGYDVQVFEGDDVIGTPLRSFHTSRLDTTIVFAETSTKYTWRVRAIRPTPNSIGPWSAAFSFRTRLGSPTALSPSSLPDSVAVQQGAVFKWTRVPGASSYRVRVIGLDGGVPFLDTRVADTTFKSTSNLPWHKKMFWSVRAEYDTNFGDWSNALFIVTPPSAPHLLTPESEELEIDPTSVSCSWSEVEGAIAFHIRVYKTIDGGPITFEDTVASPMIDLVELSSLTTYYWQVRTIGRYGAGPWSNTQPFMTRGQSTLAKPTLQTPVDLNGIDTLAATLVWASVPDAAFYHVQLTTKPSFSKPDIEWMSVHAITVECPPLVAGKTYRWRVMALSDIASGPWSNMASFTTMPGPDDALEPLTPIPGCVGVPQHGTVSFVTDSRFDEYRVEFAVNPLFTEADQIATTTEAVAPYSLLPEQEYWWHVVGLENGIALDTGSTASFTTRKDSITSVTVAADADVSIRFIGTTLMVKGADSEGATVQIMDIAGRMIHAQSELEHAQADLSKLPFGVYIAIIRFANGRVVADSFVCTN